MRTISLWQPWASAMAIGLKRNETRHWRPMHIKVPFPLAIHAAKRWTKEEQAFCREMRAVCPALPHEIPLGKVIAICTVTGFEPTDTLIKSITDLEANWGDYSPGRWGWLTEGLHALARPIPYSGKQGFFEIPDELLNDAMTARATAERG